MTSLLEYLEDVKKSVKDCVFCVPDQIFCYTVCSVLKRMAPNLVQRWRDVFRLFINYDVDLSKANSDHQSTSPDGLLSQMELEYKSAETVTPKEFEQNTKSEPFVYQVACKYFRAVQPRNSTDVLCQISNGNRIGSDFTFVPSPVLKNMKVEWVHYDQKSLWVTVKNPTENVCTIPDKTTVGVVLKWKSKQKIPSISLLQKLCPDSVFYTYKLIQEHPVHFMPGLRDPAPAKTSASASNTDMTSENTFPGSYPDQKCLLINNSPLLYLKKITQEEQWLGQLNHCQKLFISILVEKSHQSNETLKILHICMADIDAKVQVMDAIYPPKRRELFGTTSGYKWIEKNGSKHLVYLEGSEVKSVVTNVTASTHLSRILSDGKKKILYGHNIIEILKTLEAFHVKFEHIFAFCDLSWCLPQKDRRHVKPFQLSGILKAAGVYSLPRKPLDMCFTGVKILNELIKRYDIGQGVVPFSMFTSLKQGWKANNFIQTNVMSTPSYTMPPKKDAVMMKPLMESPRFSNPVDHLLLFCDMKFVIINKETYIIELGVCSNTDDNELLLCAKPPRYHETLGSHRQEISEAQSHIDCCQGRQDRTERDLLHEFLKYLAVRSADSNSTSVNLFNSMIGLPLLHHSLERHGLLDENLLKKVKFVDTKSCVSANGMVSGSVLPRLGQISQSVTGDDIFLDLKQHCLIHARQLRWLFLKLQMVPQLFSHWINSGISVTEMVQGSEQELVMPYHLKVRKRVSTILTFPIGFRQEFNFSLILDKKAFEGMDVTCKRKESELKLEVFNIGHSEKTLLRGTVLGFILKGETGMQSLAIFEDVISCKVISIATAADFLMQVPVEKYQQKSILRRGSKSKFSEDPVKLKSKEVKGQQKVKRKEPMPQNLETEANSAMSSIPAATSGKDAKSTKPSDDSERMSKKQSVELERLVSTVEPPGKSITPPVTDAALPTSANVVDVQKSSLSILTNAAPENTDETLLHSSPCSPIPSPQINDSGKKCNDNPKADVCYAPIDPEILAKFDTLDIDPQYKPFIEAYIHSCHATDKTLDAPSLDKCVFSFPSLDIDSFKDCQAFVDNLIVKSHPKNPDDLKRIVIEENDMIEDVLGEDGLHALVLALAVLGGIVEKPKMTQESRDTSQDPKLTQLGCTSSCQEDRQRPQFLPPEEQPKTNSAAAAAEITTLTGSKCTQHQATSPHVEKFHKVTSDLLPVDSACETATPMSNQDRSHIDIASSPLSSSENCQKLELDDFTVILANEDLEHRQILVWDATRESEDIYRVSHESLSRGVDISKLKMTSSNLSMKVLVMLQFNPPLILPINVLTHLESHFFFGFIESKEVCCYMGKNQTLSRDSLTSAVFKMSDSLQPGMEAVIYQPGKAKQFVVAGDDIVHIVPCVGFTAPILIHLQSLVPDCTLRLASDKTFCDKKLLIQTRNPSVFPNIGHSHVMCQCFEVSTITQVDKRAIDFVQGCMAVSIFVKETHNAMLVFIFGTGSSHLKESLQLLLESGSTKRSFVPKKRKARTASNPKMVEKGSQVVYDESDCKEGKVVLKRLSAKDITEHYGTPLQPGMTINVMSMEDGNKSQHFVKLESFTRVNVLPKSSSIILCPLPFDRKTKFDRKDLFVTLCKKNLSAKAWIMSDWCLILLVRNNSKSGVNFDSGSLVARLHHKLLPIAELSQSDSGRPRFEFSHFTIEANGKTFSIAKTINNEHVMIPKSHSLDGAALTIRIPNPLSQHLYKASRFIPHLIAVSTSNDAGGSGSSYMERLHFCLTSLLKGSWMNWESQDVKMWLANNIGLAIETGIDKGSPVRQSISGSPSTAGNTSKSVVCPAVTTSVDESQKPITPIQSSSIPSTSPIKMTIHTSQLKEVFAADAPPIVEHKLADKLKELSDQAADDGEHSVTTSRHVEDNQALKKSSKEPEECQTSSQSLQSSSPVKTSSTPSMFNLFSSKAAAIFQESVGDIGSNVGRPKNIEGDKKREYKKAVSADVEKIKRSAKQKRKQSGEGKDIPKDKEKKRRRMSKDQEISQENGERQREKKNMELARRLSVDKMPEGNPMDVIDEFESEPNDTSRAVLQLSLEIDYADISASSLKMIKEAKENMKSFKIPKKSASDPPPVNPQVVKPSCTKPKANIHSRREVRPVDADANKESPPAQHTDKFMASTVPEKAMTASDFQENITSLVIPTMNDLERVDVSDSSSSNVIFKHDKNDQNKGSRCKDGQQEMCPKASKEDSGEVNERQTMSVIHSEQSCEAATKSSNDAKTAGDEKKVLEHDRSTDHESLKETLSACHETVAEAANYSVESTGTRAADTSAEISVDLVPVSEELQVPCESEDKDGQSPTTVSSQPEINNASHATTEAQQEERLTSSEAAVNFLLSMSDSLATTQSKADCSKDVSSNVARAEDKHIKEHAKTEEVSSQESRDTGTWSKGGKSIAKVKTDPTTEESTASKDSSEASVVLASLNEKKATRKRNAEKRLAAKAKRTRITGPSDGERKKVEKASESNRYCQHRTTLLDEVCEKFWVHQSCFKKHCEGMHAFPKAFKKSCLLQTSISKWLQKPYMRVQTLPYFHCFGTRLSCHG